MDETDRCVRPISSGRAERSFERMDSPHQIRRTRLDVVPAGLVAGAGALTIAFSANGGRHGAHPFWLAAVLAESVVAVLYRRRHPFVSLAGVLAAYVVSDALALILLPLFLVLAVISATERLTFLAGVAAIAVVVSAPALQGDSLDALHVLLPLGVITLAVGAGSLWRDR
jgi:hypothetical protein